MKILLSLVLTVCCVSLYAQTNDRRPVMTLGTFHFNFPNLDVKKIEAKDQIDVLESKYQKEIEDIVDRLARFNPTIIVIERQPGEQSHVDSIYQNYLRGTYQLNRREDEQIGFRLAKMSALTKLYCVDEWGTFNENVKDIVEGRDSIQAQRFESFYYHNADSLKRTKFNPTIKTIGIRKELLLLNEQRQIQQSLGDYLIGIFKYEIEENDFTGVDFETGRWFSRNLKIFRNIQRIKTTPSDKILVIFGAGHLNLLNYFFECSPEYTLVDVKEYLK